ncbi:MAG: ATP-binding cassette domain-containing protein [Clostridia bacterium]|nr:ATP-binding cassette domain-containing protein [Clostridia bacterium]
MVIISAAEISKSYGTQEVLRDISFNVNEGDRIALIGVNGAGKTTLMKLIAGEEEPDSGSLYLSRRTSTSYMQQNSELVSDRSALTEVLGAFQHLIDIEKELEALDLSSEQDLRRYNALQEQFLQGGGLTYRQRCVSALKGLSFSDEEMNLSLSQISGGQRTRALLAKILLSDADVLLLDEPTNHLDMKALAWLEDFVSESKKTVIFISHDRYFIDKIATKTFELSNGHIRCFDGGYSDYLVKKEVQDKSVMRQNEQKRKEIARIESMIEQQKRWNQERNYVTIRSKRKAQERIRETIEEDPFDESSISFTLKARNDTGNEVLRLEGLSKSFNGTVLFSDIDLLILKRQRTFLLGENGTGKTTLFRIIMGQQTADSGKIVLGSRVKPGYYEQSFDHLRTDLSVIDILRNAYPLAGDTLLRNTLAQFLFRGDSVFKTANTLSGGELARVALCLLMMSGSNFLLLDEPTNHLDIASREALEDALIKYDGTYLIISHDRYFIEKMSDRILELNDKALTAYEGDYEYYLRRKALQQEAGKVQEQEPAQKQKNNEYLKQKEKRARERKLVSDLSKAENRIGSLETRKRELENELDANGTAYEEVLKITKEISDIDIELEKLYDFLIENTD